MFTADATQRRIHTHQMRPRFPPLPQRCRDQKRAEPGLPRERRVSFPGVPQEGRRKKGRIGLHFRGGAPPRLELFGLFRVWIIDERIAEKRRPGRAARKDLCAAV